MTTAAAPTTDRTKALDEVVRRISEISTLPQVAMEVMRVAGDSEAGAADLKRVVENDPALSARVLRMVNSAAYAVRSTVNNLHQAISYLGFTQVRNLAMTASVSELFKDVKQIGPYDRKSLWHHMVSVGICSRLVARRCKLSNFEDAFLGGLLHDIGLILEDQHDHERFSEAMQTLSPDMGLCERETEVLGYSHTLLGDRMAESWRFPPVARASIRHHHASLVYRGEASEVVRCVEIANVVCTMKGITSVGQKLVKMPGELFRQMQFGRDDIVVLAADLDREIQESESLFEM